MSKLVGVAGLKCEDIQNLTVLVEHISPNTLYFWLSKFVCEVANLNGERALSAQFALFVNLCGLF